MISKLMRFARSPVSRRIQRVRFFWETQVTRWWYGLRIRKLGARVIIGKPLFWTPEYLEIGNNVLIWPGSRFEGINISCEGNVTSPRIVIGDSVSFEQHCHIIASNHVEIRSGTAISFGVMVTDTDHGYQDVNLSPYKQNLKVQKTVIGENCLIGARATIQAGTVLGRHCVVGTNAVVRGEFPEYSVLAGVPARIIKRYDPEMKAWRRTCIKGKFL